MLQQIQSRFINSLYFLVKSLRDPAVTDSKWMVVFSLSYLFTFSFSTLAILMSVAWVSGMIPQDKYDHAVNILVMLVDLLDHQTKQLLSRSRSSGTDHEPAGCTDDVCIVPPQIIQPTEDTIDFSSSLKKQE